MYSSTMKVEVELEYRAVPSDEEFEIIREAGKRLTIDPKSVSVRLVKTEKYPLVILEFAMKNQAQYKVVNEISDEVQRWLGELFNDIAIRFHQPRKSRVSASKKEARYTDNTPGVCRLRFSLSDQSLPVISLKN